MILILQTTEFSTHSLKCHMASCRKQINVSLLLRGLVRQRTIPTERPLLVGEISANFSG
jgi:hypothetical protein